MVIVLREIGYSLHLEIIYKVTLKESFNQIVKI